jgi:D-glycero-alpha-D-manno-heptose-7-phosphate kinase
MLYTGITRSASGILKEQKEIIKSDEIKKKTMIKMVDIAYEIRKSLESNNLSSFGEALHESWMLKRSLTKDISNDLIDGWYSKARENGAIGGKILGAGAGGFLALYAPPSKQEAICHALPELKRVSVAFDRLGSQIIFYQ